MSDRLIVSSSPHFSGKMTTAKIMGGVLIALAPAVIASCILFGLRALLVIAVCVAACVACEYLCRIAMKREQTVGDLSAAVTGVLLALSLPVDVGIGQAVFGCVCAIVVIKQFFSGIGQNFINPALGARIIMLVSFPDSMTTYTYDGITTATPLSGGEADTLDLWLGTMGGIVSSTTCTTSSAASAFSQASRMVLGAVIMIEFDSG